MHKNKRSENELQEIIHDAISFYGQLGDAIVNGAIGRLRKREDRIFLRALVSGALMATFVCIMISIAVFVTYSRPQPFPDPEINLNDTLQMNQPPIRDSVWKDTVSENDFLI